MFTVKFEDHYGNWRLAEAEEVRVGYDVPQGDGDPAVILVRGGDVAESTLITFDNEREFSDMIRCAVNAYIENDQGKTTQVVRPRHDPVVGREAHA